MTIPLTLGPVHHLRLTVTDVGRSRAFYTELLGFQTAVDTPPPVEDPHHDLTLDLLQGGVVLANGDLLLVARLQLLPADGDRGGRPVEGRSQAKRQGRVGMQGLDLLSASKQQGLRVSGVDPAQKARVCIQLGECRGDEGLATERRRHRAVNGLSRVGQRQPGPAGIAVRRDRQHGEQCAAQAVSHPVEDRQRCAAGVHGIVHGIAGNLVCRLQRCSDRDLPAGERERRQQGPLHLRCQPDLLPAPQPDQRVSVQRLRHHELRGQPNVLTAPRR